MEHDLDLLLYILFCPVQFKGSKEFITIGLAVKCEVDYLAKQL